MRQCCPWSAGGGCGCTARVVPLCLVLKWVQERWPSPLLMFSDLSGEELLTGSQHCHGAAGYGTGVFSHSWEYHWFSSQKRRMWNGWGNVVIEIKVGPSKKQPSSFWPVHTDVKAFWETSVPNSWDRTKYQHSRRTEITVRREWNATALKSSADYFWGGGGGGQGITQGQGYLHIQLNSLKSCFLFICKSSC